MKSFQLRAARAVLNLGVREIGQYVGVTGSTVSVWEGIERKRDIPTSEENIKMLEQFFIINNILFSNDTTISLIESENEETFGKRKSPTSDAISRFQLRAARAILKLERKELANLVGSSSDVIARAEKLNNIESIRPADTNVPVRIKDFFRSECITFPTPTTIIVK